MNEIKMTNWRTSLLNICFIVLIPVALQGCFGLKTSSTNAASKLYQTFYMGDKGTQYFIKPLLLKSSNDEVCSIDFTCLSKNLETDSAIVNFSIFTQTLHKELHSAHFTNEQCNIVISSPERLFSEKKGELFESRFTTKYPLKEIKALFNSENWIFKYLTAPNESSAPFKPTRKIQKSIRRLNENVIVLF